MEILPFIVPVVIAALGLIYQQRQHRLAMARLTRELEQEKRYKQIAKNHGYAIRCLQVVFDAMVRTGPSSSSGVYTTVTRDEDLRLRIQSYLGKQNYGAGQFEPYQLSADLLLNPECCRTIADVIEGIDQYKKKHPDEAHQLDLQAA